MLFACTGSFSKRVQDTYYVSGAEVRPLPFPLLPEP